MKSPIARTVTLAVCGLAASALAQADFAEDFESNGVVQGGVFGPENLIARGWIFRNQSEPVNGPAWYDGNNFGGAPFEGDGYLGTDSLATDYLGGAMSVWAILPDIPAQQAGDLLSVWVMGGNSVSDTYFEIRYSPTGGTGTGSDEDDVGDFTEVLFSAEMPLSRTDYQQILETLPGEGRVAMRFWAPWIMTAFGRGTYFSLDSLTVGAAPPPPCGVPIPQPGETVVWSLDNSPYTICESLLIPETSTVIVEPGVTVNFDADRTLRVDGELIALGTPQQPIHFGGDDEVGSGLEVFGRADLAHVELATDYACVGGENVLLLRDSTVFAGAQIWGSPDVAVVERCSFEGGILGALSGSLRITDCDFSAGGYANLIGVLYLDNLTFDGGPLLIAGEAASAPNLLDNISIANVTSGGGLQVYGNNFLLGPGFVTQNNRYPVEFDILGAGLLPGSTLPATGNTLNHVRADGMVLGNKRQWADTGIPYVVSGFPDNFGGSLKIEPGTTVQFLPGAGAFFVLNAELEAEGTAEEPIRFESYSQTQPWFGLKWVDNFLARQRHVIYDGAEIAIQSDGGELWLDHCTVQNSDIGAASQTGGRVTLRSSRILDNAIGMTTTTTGRIDAQDAEAPNVFAGNALAVDYNNNTAVPTFDHNWWNSPTGPTTDENPGGDGDPVHGLLAAWFTPFLTSPPALTDETPRIDLEPLYFMVNSRSKVILRWSSSDDSSVATHLVQFADHAFPDQFRTIATLGGDEFTYEFTAPVVEPTNQYTTPSGIRIVAIDDAGQESWDEAVIRIPYQEDFQPVYQEIQNLPDLLHPHDNMEVCWEPGGSSTIYTCIDDAIVTDYHGGAGNCLPNGAIMPYVSTDRARMLVFTSYGAGGRVAYSFSDYFSIRPDALYGDAPPVVELTSPPPGAAYEGGGVVPVRWTATDDESVRSIAIQATYDRGKSWHYVEDELDPSLSEFNWRLPASTGIEDVLVRVVATDHRFQNSSATSSAFDILPGDAGGCEADLDGDGDADSDDFFSYLDAFASGDDGVCDLDGDGDCDSDDFFAYLDLFAIGC